MAPTPTKLTYESVVSVRGDRAESRPGPQLRLVIELLQELEAENPGAQLASFKMRGSYFAPTDQADFHLTAEIAPGRPAAEKHAERLAKIREATS